MWTACEPPRHAGLTPRTVGATPESSRNTTVTRGEAIRNDVERARALADRLATSDERPPDARETTPALLVTVAAHSMNVPERQDDDAGGSVAAPRGSNDDARRSLDACPRADDDAGASVAIHGRSSDAPRRRVGAATHSSTSRIRDDSLCTHSRDAHGRSSRARSALEQSAIHSRTTRTCPVAVRDGSRATASDVETTASRREQGAERHL
jgi:hypothetical protein